MDLEVVRVIIKFSGKILYLYLVLAMMIDLDILYFLVIWVVNNSGKLVLPLIQLDDWQFFIYAFGLQ